MRRYRNLTSVLTVLLLVGTGAGCENASQIAGPADQAPQFAHGNGNGNDNARPHTTSTPVAWADGVPSGSVSATLPSGGGTLEITDGDNVVVALEVPGGAAPGGPITFSMTLACPTAGACDVQLDATRNGRDASSFRKGVKLHINLAYLDVDDGSRITIAESHGNDRYTPVPTREVDGFLIGTLNHFSAYVPITD